MQMDKKADMGGFRSEPGSVTKARTCKHNVWTKYVDGICGCLHLSRSQLDTQRGFVSFVLCVSRRPPR